MIDCPSCKKPISELAKKCPQCGFPLRDVSEMAFVGCAIVVIAIIVIGFLILRAIL